MTLKNVSIRASVKSYDLSNVWDFTDLLPISGTTLERPKNVITGFQYFDKTLGAVIFWDGTSWINSVGEKT